MLKDQKLFTINELSDAVMYLDDKYSKKTAKFDVPFSPLIYSNPDMILSAANANVVLDCIDPYIDLYMNILSINNEDARIIKIPSNEVISKTLCEKLNEIREKLISGKMSDEEATNHPLLNSGSKYSYTQIYLFIRNIKNDKFFNTFRDYNGWISEVTRTAYIELFPASTFDSLDRLSNAIIRSYK